MAKKAITFQAEAREGIRRGVKKLAAAVKRHYKRLRSQQLPPKLF
jgi:hypothetical protein